MRKTVLQRETDRLFANQNQIYNKYEDNDHINHQKQVIIQVHVQQQGFSYLVFKGLTLID